MFANAPAGVQRVSPVVIVPTRLVVTSVAIAANVQRADGRTIGQFLDDSGNLEIVAGCEIFDGLGTHVEQADIGAVAELAGQPGAGFDGRDPAIACDADSPAEEQLHFLRIAHRKLAGVLEEERPFLREEEVEAVEIELLLIRFYLREIRVDRQVQRQAWRDGILDVHTDFAIGFGTVEFAATLCATKRVGRDFQVALRRWRHADQRARVGHPVEGSIQVQR